MRASCELRIAKRGEGAVLEGMLREHLRVLATWNPRVDVEQSLDEQWFERPGELWPYLIESGGELAGFALVCGERYARAMGAEAEFYLHEFHIAEGQRRRGIGRAAARMLFERHAGHWMLDVLPENARASAFWRALLASSASCSEHIADGVTFERWSLNPSQP